jgi:REP element-mobilizing transposase RayT
MTTRKTKQHGKDLRKGRFSEKNRIYLVTTVTNQRQKIFTDFSLGRLVVYAIRYQHQQQKVNSIAFVVMPDHIHWLFALQNECSLAEVMHSVKGRSAHKIQKICRERNEISSRQALWQKGYHDHALRKEEDLKQVARYIIAHPIRAGIVDKIANYPLWDATWL